jgi:hypothetical protein
MVLDRRRRARRFQVVWRFYLSANPALFVFALISTLYIKTGRLDGGESICGFSVCSSICSGSKILYSLVFCFYCVALPLPAEHRTQQCQMVAAALMVAISLYASPVSFIIILEHLLFVLSTRNDLVKICMFSIPKARHWTLGREWDFYIKDASLFSTSRKPFLITDFAFKYGMINSMVVLLECGSENIDILRASPDIGNVDKILSKNDYSDVSVFHASNQLISNLKSQFAGKMEKLDVKSISSTLKIIIEK